MKTGRYCLKFKYYISENKKNNLNYKNYFNSILQQHILGLRMMSPNNLLPVLAAQLLMFSN